MKELHVETNTIINSHGADKVKSHIYLIDLWWLFWIINGIAGNISFLAFNKTDTLPDLIETTIASMVTHVVGIPLAILAIILVIKQAKIEADFAAVYNDNSAVEN